MRDRYASLREGLVGAWIPSVSGSGLLLPDLSGNGNNGTLTNMGPEDWVSSQYGRALDFDGSNDYVNFGNPAALQLTSVMSVSCWFRKATGISSFATWLVSKDGTAGRSYALILGQPILNNAVRFSIFRSSSEFFVDSSAITDTNWHHVCGVNDGTNLRIYLDGEESGSAIGGGIIDNTSVNFWLGSRDDGNPTRYFSGNESDIRIYNRALSEPEIKLLSQEPGVGFKRTRSVFDFGRKPAYLPPTPTDYRTVRVKQTEHASLREGLVGAWCPSIEGSGYTLPDLSGQGNNGTLTNMGPEDWVSSQYGRALDFDGVNDYVLAPSINPAVISIASWVYFTDDLSHIFVAKRNLANYSWEIGRNASNDQLLVRINANTNVATGGALPINTWSHVCGTYDRSTIRAYINGTIVGTFNYSTAITTSTLKTSLAGRALYPGAEGFAPLQLDDIRIYNRALSEPEIKLLASRPGIGLRPQRRTMYYAPPTGARRRRILTSMP